LSRPIVPLKNLAIHDYQIKKISLLESNTGTTLKPQNFKYFSIYSIESKFWILFNNGKTEEIQDIKKNISGTTNIISRKQDHVIEISFIGNKAMHRPGEPLTASLKVEDKLVNKIYDELRTLKQLQYDRYYWKRHSISYLGAGNLRKTIEIYPRTPFLADGEEMIWQSLTLETIDKERKVTKIDGVTNIRIFQYDYKKHYGEGILIPDLDNNMTVDERPVLQVNSVGTYFVASYNITGIKSGTTKIIGDITFYVNDKPLITFTQITELDKKGARNMQTSDNIYVEFAGHS
jgi:hypothetical protein